MRLSSIPLWGIIVLLSLGNWAGALEVQTPVTEDLRAVVTSNNTASLSLEVTFSNPELRIYSDEEQGDRLVVDMPGAVIDFDREGPALPGSFRLIAVPAGYSVRARVIDREETQIDVQPTIARDQMRRSLRSAAEQQNEVVTVGEAGWMRHVRVAPVWFTPARYDAENHCVYVTERLSVEFEFYPDPNGNINSVQVDERYHSMAFDELFRVLLLNPDSLPFIIPGGAVYQRGSYIIITDSALALSVNEFAAWKARKGFNVVVASLYNNQITADQIKDYIQDAYDNWERPPEFVLFLGDVNMPGIRLPTYRIENPGRRGEWDVTDLPYSLLAGEDYFPDIFVGRISSDSPSPTDARKALRRILNYEQNIANFDRNAFSRATVFAGNFGEGNAPVLSPVETSRWLAERLRGTGYQVDEIYYTGRGNEDNSSGPIIRSINRGVNLVSYRGWADARGTHYPQFYKNDLDQLTNEQPLPVFTFYVCNTGDYGNDNINPCFGEYSITRGTLQRQFGALAFYGPSDLHTNTRFNNPMLAGYYSGLMYYNVRNVGALTLLGKMQIYAAYPNQRRMGGENNYVEFYFSVYNVLGDPETNVYFRPPTVLQVELPDEFKVGATSARVIVKDENQRPVSGALVYMKKGDETDISVFTDQNGLALIPINCASVGEMEVSVVAHQAATFTTEIPVVEGELMVSLHSVQASNGFGSDVLVTGSPVDLIISLSNTGRQSVSGVRASISSILPAVHIETEEITYGDIASGASSAGEGPFVVMIDPSLYPQTSVPFEINIMDGSGNEYQGLFRLNAQSGGLKYVSHLFGDGPIEPDETDDFIITVANFGQLGIDGLRGQLSSFDDAVEIVKSDANFGNVAASSEIDCSDDPFRVHIRDQVYNGRRIAMRLAMYDEDDMLVNHVFFNITVGVPGITDPLGPDAYGYYAYDDVDEGFDATPSYNWIELDPRFGGSGADHHPLTDDSTFSMELPFTFKYYGDEYNDISICSNGWFSFEVTWMWDFRNNPIPSPLGPHALVAPFWDDLVGQMVDGQRTYLDIFTRYDADEGRFIIQWSHVVSRTTIDDVTQTFQAILYNPQRYATPTGDGEMVFQYNEIQLVDRAEGIYATVGMQDWLHFRGLQITYANEFAEAAAPLAAGRAIKITTVKPDPYLSAPEYSDNIPSEFALFEPYPNPFNAMTTVSYSLPERMTANIRVFDLNGRMLKSIAMGTQEAGVQRVVINADDMPSGLYLLQLEADNHIAQRKLLLLR